jgi:type IV pilus assembly protein PilA
MKTCPRCAKLSPDHSGYCIACGAELPPDPETTLAPDQVAAPSGPVETSGKAIGSLICGIFFWLFPAAVAAVVLGHLSLSQIRKSAGRLKGEGMAIAGLVLGYTGVAVIPIVLIIAAIAIPNLLRSKMVDGVDGEANAVRSLRIINTALIVYATTYGHGFPENLQELGPPAAGASPSERSANLVDADLARGRKADYAFSYVAESKHDKGVRDAYHVAADPIPIMERRPGQRHFFTDESAVIRAEMSRAATKDSPPL